MKLVKNMNEILDVFYNDFIKEAATGRIDCNMFYNILFATNILRDGKVEVLTTAKTNYQNVMVPTLEIKNEREWNDLLIKYVEQAIDFYDSKDFEDVDNIPKSIMARLFANMTLENFKEPERFLKKRIAFLEDDTILSLPNDLGYVSTLDANLRLVVKKERIQEETPYALHFYLENPENPNDVFHFPYVRVGIENDTAYIYAIQRKIENGNTPFVKKVSRQIRKTGEGIDLKQEPDDFSNVKDITDSFLCALTLSLGVLDSLGIRDVSLETFLIERWNAKEIFYDMVNEHTKDDEKRRENSEIHDRIQTNMSDKLIRTMRRMTRHTNRITITAEPFDGTSALHAKIDRDQNAWNNSLLQELYESRAKVTTKQR